MCEPRERRTERHSPFYKHCQFSADRQFDVLLLGSNHRRCGVQGTWGRHTRRLCNGCPGSISHVAEDHGQLPVSIAPAYCVHALYFPSSIPCPVQQDHRHDTLCRSVLARMLDALRRQLLRPGTGTAEPWGKRSDTFTGCVSLACWEISVHGIASAGWACADNSGSAAISPDPALQELVGSAWAHPHACSVSCPQLVLLVAGLIIDGLLSSGWAGRGCAAVLPGSGAGTLPRPDEPLRRYSRQRRLLGPSRQLRDVRPPPCSRAWVMIQG